MKRGPCSGGSVKRGPCPAGVRSDSVRELRKTGITVYLTKDKTGIGELALWLRQLQFLFFVSYSAIPVFHAIPSDSSARTPAGQDTPPSRRCLCRHIIPSALVICRGRRRRSLCRLQIFSFRADYLSGSGGDGLCAGFKLSLPGWLSIQSRMGCFLRRFQIFSFRAGYLSGAGEGRGQGCCDGTVKQHQHLGGVLCRPMCLLCCVPSESVCRNSTPAPVPLLPPPSKVDFATPPVLCYPIR